MFHQISKHSERGAAEFFLTNFEVFGYLMKHYSEYLIYVLMALIILREIQTKSSSHFILIRITTQILRHEMLCYFSPMTDVSFVMFQA